VTYQPKKYSDFAVYASLRNFTVSIMREYKAIERPITKDFKDFSMELAFPYSKLFGGSSMGIPLLSFESDRIAAATISQFEIPPKSGYYRDFTFNLRPRYEFRAPVFHIDFMKPSPGVPGLCTMDFFDVDPQNIKLKAFFGREIEHVQKALTLVEKYQRKVEEGRGKITRYLDPYKSKYRMELKEPSTDDETIRKEYYETVAAAYKLVLPAYMKCLYKLQPDPNYAKQHKEKTRVFVKALYDHDFAVNMGKKIFGKHFKKYFMDGFWNVQL
jgi:hypothetical protein